MFFKYLVFCTLCKNSKIVRKFMQGYLRTEDLENIKNVRLYVINRSHYLSVLIWYAKNKEKKDY